MEDQVKTIAKGIKEQRWMENYRQLLAYVEQHHQFPDKKKVENRRLLNWWKYNKRKINNNTLSDEKLELLADLSAMRTLHR